MTRHNTLVMIKDCKPLQGAATSNCTSGTLTRETLVPWRMTWMPHMEPVKLMKRQARSVERILRCVEIMLLPKPHWTEKSMMNKGKMAKLAIFQPPR